MQYIQVGILSPPVKASKKKTKSFQYLFCHMISEITKLVSGTHPPFRFGVIGDQLEMLLVLYSNCNYGKEIEQSHQSAARIRDRLTASRANVGLFLQSSRTS
jgi:hypothetical protein